VDVGEFVAVQRALAGEPGLQRREQALGGGEIPGLGGLLHVRELRVNLVAQRRRAPRPLRLPRPRILGAGAGRARPSRRREQGRQCEERGGNAQPAQAAAYRPALPALQRPVHSSSS